MTTSQKITGSTLVVLGFFAWLLPQAFLGQESYWTIPGILSPLVLTTVILLLYRISLNHSIFPIKPLYLAREPIVWVSILSLALFAFVSGQIAGLWAFTQFGSNNWELNRELYEIVDPQIMLFSSVFIAPLTEEIVLRGLLYNWLRHYLPAMESIVFSSVIFAFLHGNIVQIIVTLPISFVLSLAYEISRRVWVTYLIHATFNALAYLPGTLFAPFLDPITAVLGLLLFLLLFVYIFIQLPEQGEYLWQTQPDRKHHGTTQTL